MTWQPFGFLDIAQMGTSVVINNLSECESIHSTLTGVVSSDIAMVEGDLFKDFGSSCTGDFHYDETITRNGNQLNGTFTITVNNSAGCLSGQTPCDFIGTLAGVWCDDPRVDCTPPPSCP